MIAIVPVTAMPYAEARRLLEPNMTAVTEGALHGLLESLDANSSYLSAAQYKDYKAHQNEGRATIGATVSKRFGYATIVSVIPNGPADKAGIDDGDIFEAIEGRSTRELSLVEIQSLLNGTAGSNVTVSVVRASRADPVRTPFGPRYAGRSRMPWADSWNSRI